MNSPTPFLIAMATGTGFRSARCDNAGELSYAGHKLLGCYRTPDRARRLIARGDLKQLGHNLRPDTLEDGDFRFGRPTMAYGRDPVEHPDFASLARAAIDRGATALYVWRGDAWYFAAVAAGMVASDLRPLTPGDIERELRADIERKKRRLIEEGYTGVTDGPIPHFHPHKGREE
jgi:hypothetical protein